MRMIGETAHRNIIYFSPSSVRALWHPWSKYWGLWISPAFVWRVSIHVFRSFSASLNRFLQNFGISLIFILKFGAWSKSTENTNELSNELLRCQLEYAQDEILYTQYSLLDYATAGLIFFRFTMVSHCKLDVGLHDVFFDSQQIWTS
jgi:hypothetical protein